MGIVRQVDSEADFKVKKSGGAVQVEKVHVEILSLEFYLRACRWLCGDRK